MRYRWLVDVVAGLILIVAPFVERFTMDRPALYTSVGVGVLLLAWAVVSTLRPSDLQGSQMSRTHA